MKIIAFVTCLMFSIAANAQVAIKEGDAAPSDGVFLTNRQAAKILAEKEANDKLCEARIGYEKEKVESVCKLEKQKLQISLDLQEQKYKEIVTLKEEEIKRLYGQIEENSSNYGPYLFAGGFVAGAVVAVVTSVSIFFAATQIDKTPALITVP